ncbi:MAG: MBL fold metallo-hydrolase, partial [Steroidobacteraceae bacterium]
LDIDTLVRLEKAHGPRVLTGLGNRAFLRSFGLERVEELDWWQDAQTDGGSATFVPAKHWSARSGRNRNRTLWGGFLLNVGGRKILFAGDTGYGPLFGEMRERCASPDIALLPIGAYEPRWFMQPQHMNPEEAVRAHLDLGARVSVGMHFGCFQLTDEGIDDPIVELDDARRRFGVTPEQFQVLEIGETRVYRQT